MPGAPSPCLVPRTGELLVTIDNDGPGIAAAELERVFEPFRRLESSRNRGSGGSGLGRALVRAAIGAHGGSVDLANRPEAGLRARVVLPGRPTASERRRA